MARFDDACNAVIALTSLVVGLASCRILNEEISRLVGSLRTDRALLWYIMFWVLAFLVLLGLLGSFAWLVHYLCRRWHRGRLLAVLEKARKTQNIILDQLHRFHMELCRETEFDPTALANLSESAQRTATVLEICVAAMRSSNGSIPPEILALLQVAGDLTLAEVSGTLAHGPFESRDDVKWRVSKARWATDSITLVLRRLGKVIDSRAMSAGSQAPLLRRLGHTTEVRSGAEAE